MLNDLLKELKLAEAFDNDYSDLGGRAGISGTEPMTASVPGVDFTPTGANADLQQDDAQSEVADKVKNRINQVFTDYPLNKVHYTPSEEGYTFHIVLDNEVQLNLRFRDCETGDSKEPVYSAVVEAPDETYTAVLNNAEKLDGNLIYPFELPAEFLRELVDKYQKPGLEFNQ